MSGADHDPSCIFCKIARAEVPAELVHADDEVVAFNDVSPQAPVHILVVPRIHLASVADLGDNEELAGRLLTVAARVARDRGLVAEGYRIAVNHGRHGTQSVNHVHLHVLGGRQLRGSLG